MSISHSFKTQILPPDRLIVTFKVFKLIEALLPSLPYFYSYLHWFFRSDTFVSIPFLFITYYISRNTKMSISHSFKTQILPPDRLIVTFKVFKLIEALLPSLPYFYSYLHWFFRSDTFVSIPFLFITYYISRNTKMSISHSFKTQILPPNRLNHLVLWERLPQVYSFSDQ